MDSTNRIPLLDAIRGFCIILVVAFHLGYTLVVSGYLPLEAIDNLPLRILQPFFAGIFILLAGVSSKFSKNNLKRGLILALCAGAVTGASFIVGTPITFGILHLLASCILLFALLEKLKVTLPAILLAGFFVLFFGITIWPDVNSADFFPLIPWGFLFFFGTYIADSIKDGKLPEWFYTVNVPIFPYIGRKSLIIYLVHQPVFFGIIWGIEAI